MFITSAPAPPSNTLSLSSSHVPLSFTCTFRRTKPGKELAVVTTRGVSLVAVPLSSSELSSPESVHLSSRPVTAALPLSLSTSVTVNVIVSLRAYSSGFLSVVPMNASFSAEAENAASSAAPARIVFFIEWFPCFCLYMPVSP